MGKRRHIKAEKLESDILKILRKNARKKIADMASELGVASSTVLHHMKDMQKSGMIRGYTVISNQEEMFQLKCIALIKAKPPLIRHVAESIGKINETLLIYEGSITPTTNLFCLLHAQNPEHLAEILYQVRHIEGVDHVESHVLTRKTKERLFIFR